MIIHAYFTNGFFHWAKLFLESYKFHNGDDIKIIFSTRELNKEQISELSLLYKNLEIQNKDFNIKALAKTARVSPKTLLEFKRQMEQEHVTEKNKVWKLMIAADDRVKSILEVIKQNRNEDYMLHFDIDMYIRDNLKELIDFITSHEISIRLRLHSKPNRKTLISVQGYKICKKSITFLEKWIKYIDNIPPHKRPLGYGQTSCWYAYKDIINKVDWGSVKRKFAAPQMYNTDIIWAGNTPTGKVKNLQLCYTDFNKIRGKIK